MAYDNGTTIKMNDPANVKRSRNRRINTCLECRRLKRRCSRTFPCTHCLKTSRECVFPVGKQSNSSTPQDESTASLSQQDLPDAAFQNEFDVPRQPADSGAKGKKQLDICLRLGKLSITERIGGVLRANFVQSLEELLQDSPKMNANTQFSAPLVAWFKPHTVLPLSQLFSGNGETPEDFPLSEMQEQALTDQYFVAVHPVCPLVSAQDLEGNSILASAIRAAVFYAAAVSLPLLQSQKLFGITKDSLVKKLKTLAETALCESDILSCLDMQVFKALLIYLTPQLLSEVSRSHSIFLGMVIRHFQIAGFDRDCNTDTVLERQTKRHLWQHLLFLNIRAAEAVGPERTVFDDEAAELPDHDDFLQTQTPGISNLTYIVALVRYECYKIHRWIFRERESLKQGRRTLQMILGRLNEFDLNVRAKYLDHLNENIPIQKYAGLVGKLLLARAEGMILQSQRDKWAYPETALGMKERVIRVCLDTVESGVVLETDPDLSQWAWYAPAYQQYHSMLFPLACLYTSPHLPETDRIMAIADHVFGPSPTTSPRERSEMILRAIKENMASFLATIDQASLGAKRKRPPEDDTDVNPPAQHRQNDHNHSADTTDGRATIMVDDQDMNYFGFNPSIEATADTWWRWPLQTSLLDQDELFREMNIF